MKFKENEIVKWNDIEYRVIRVFENLTLLIQMNGQSVHLIRAATSRINEMIDSGKATIEIDPWADIAIREGSNACRSVAKENYKEILPFLSNPELYSEDGIELLTKAASPGDPKRARRLRLMIAQYWRRGQHPNALIPMYKGNPGRASGGRKRGRRAGEGKEEGTPLTPKLLQLMNEYCRKAMSGEENGIQNKKPKLKESYQNLVELIHSFNEEAGESGERIGIPSYYQFYYFYRTRYGTKSKESN